MSVEEKKSTGTLIRDLFLVLSLGIFCAVLVAVVTLYYVGPAGSYTAKNILLDPSMLDKLSYSDLSAQTGGPIPYHFNRLEFLYFTEKTQQWKKKQVSKEAYAKFYGLIANDQSLTVVSDQVKALFPDGTPSTLSIVVKEQGEAQQTHAFQQVQILNYGDYYRIQIHDQEEMKNWAYFYHENIFEDSLKVLL